jgi:hypothetical protein
MPLATIFIRGASPEENGVAVEDIGKRVRVKGKIGEIVRSILLGIMIFHSDFEDVETRYIASLGGFGFLEFSRHRAVLIVRLPKRKVSQRITKPLPLYPSPFILPPI